MNLIKLSYRCFLYAISSIFCISLLQAPAVGQQIETGMFNRSAQGTDGVAIKLSPARYGKIGFIGDINADGVDDIIAGVINQPRIIYGQRDWPQTSVANQDAVSTTILADRILESFGAAGDVNGDGFDDLVFGGYHPGTVCQSSLVEARPELNSFILFGSSTLGSEFDTSKPTTVFNGTNGVALVGPTSCDHYRHRVSGAGDINNDGLGDVVVSSGRGTTVIFGSPSLPAAINLQNIAQNAGTGFHIDGSEQTPARAGDVNGDGFDDVLLYDNRNAYVIYGRATFASNYSLSAINASDGFIVDLGQSGDKPSLPIVRGVGDANADGFDDLGILSEMRKSRLYSRNAIIFGGSSLQNQISLTSLPDTAGIKLNRHLNRISAAADINNDSLDDVVFANSRRMVNGKKGAGQSYVLFGDQTLSGTIDLQALNGTSGFQVNGFGPNNGQGTYVAGGGDINDDGVSDVLLLTERFNGSPDRDGSNVDPAHYGERFIFALFGRSGVGSNRLSSDDADGDGYPDGTDNCPLLANVDQKNVDIDNYGDACDLDSDNDSIDDTADNCVFEWNPDQADNDGNTVGDRCENRSLVRNTVYRDRFGPTDSNIVSDHVIFAFEGGVENLLLKVRGYNLLRANQVSIWLNGKQIGNVRMTAPQKTGGLTRLFIPLELQRTGDNKLEFWNDYYWGDGTYSRWGIQDIGVRSINGSEINLQSGVKNRDRFGYRYPGAQTRSAVLRTVFSGKDSDMRLSVRGYDIDSNDEVSVFLNDTKIGTLRVTPNNGESVSVWTLPKTQLLDRNVLEFRQKKHGYKWGVRNLFVRPAP